MRGLTPLELKPWALPLVVLALVLPIAGAALLVGTVGAFVAGAVMAAALIVIAARATFDEEIEVAAPVDRRYHLLVAITATIEEPRALEAIADAARRGAGGRDDDQRTDLLVLAPALNPGLAHWASDLRGARMAAQERLTVTLAGLAAAGLEARGRVGDTDPIQAIEDELRSFPAQELILAAPAGEGAELLDELRRRLDRPVRRLEAGPHLSRARREGA